MSVRQPYTSDWPLPRQFMTRSVLRIALTTFFLEWAAPLVQFLRPSNERHATVENPMPDESLIIFLKAPRLGSVKTRLAQTIGAEPACAAYRHLVEALFHNLASVPEAELRFAPDDAEAEIQSWLRPGWKSRPQGGGDLGERLQRAFAETFSAGAKRVVIIGSDCPAITPRDIAEAWRALQSHDLVLGPATDGGYWLIGLNQVQPDLFTNISWSTESVLAETLERARAIAARVRLLRELVDVDTETEWRAFLKRTQADAD